MALLEYAAKSLACAGCVAPTLGASREEAARAVLAKHGRAYVYTWRAIPDGTGRLILKDRQVFHPDDIAKAVRTLTAVQDFSALSREEQMRHTAAVSVFAVVAELTKEKAIQKVEAGAEKHLGKGEMSLTDTLAAFRKE